MSAFRLSRLSVLIGATLCLALACAPGPAPAAIPAGFSVTDLGSLRLANDGSSSALGLNNLNEVVGVADAEGGSRRAFRWDSGSGIQDLHPAISFGGADSAAAGINDGGAVVGESDTPLPSSHAFFQDGGVQDLNGLGPFLGGQNSRATAVNTSGAVCGWAQINGGAIFPFRWTLGGGISQLFTPGATGGKAFAINTAGTAAGSIDLPGKTLAAVWQPGGSLLMIEFKKSLVQEAYGLNDSAFVVGARRDKKGKWRAWIGDLTTQKVSLLKKPKGAQHSRAFDINNQGQIVGSAEGATPASAKATLWEGKVTVDLNKLLPPNSGWNLLRAFAINDTGRIVGEGTFQGATRAFLLTPQ